MAGWKRAFTGIATLIPPVLLAVPAGLPAASQTPDPSRVARACQPGLDRLLELRDRVRHLHPFLATLHPVAVVEQQHIFVFEPDPGGNSFALSTHGPAPMPIPEGIRASFPLEMLGSRPACVVTPEVFDSLEGYAAIFHEFVHCRQMELGEMQLKQGLAVYREARGDPMWELNHPFPYREEGFQSLYADFLVAAEDGGLELVLGLRRQLRQRLAGPDHEYMVWQEWKEGMARLIENLVRKELGLAPNRGGRKPPFSRVTFYAGGEAFIRFLTKSQPELLTEIDRLLPAMLQGLPGAAGGVEAGP